MPPETADFVSAAASLLNIIQVIILPVLGWIVMTLWNVSHKVREIDTRLGFVLKNGGPYNGGSNDGR